MGTKARTTTLVSEEDEETPLRGIFCLKTRQDMKRIEKTEDCFILDFDPFDTFYLTRLSLSGDKDFAIIHETGQVLSFDILCFRLGFTSIVVFIAILKQNLMEYIVEQVACRDYPHPRHLCLNFPFGSTPNANHCDLVIFILSLLCVYICPFF